jgi:membrane protein DedA with SNARE-associated domain
MNMAKFVIYTFVGSYPWCYGLAWVGMKLGAAWNTDPRLKSAFHRFDLAIGVALLAGVAWFAWHKLKGAKGAGAVGEDV